MSEQFDINSAEEFSNKIGKRLDKARKRDFDADKTDKEPIVAHHAAAMQFIKAISVISMHPIIKKIMIMRISGPLNGKPCTRMAVAIELGIREHEVKKLEEEGQQILAEFMAKVSSKDFVEKFNRDKKLKAEFDNLNG